MQDIREKSGPRVATHKTISEFETAVGRLGQAPFLAVTPLGFSAAAAVVRRPPDYGAPSEDFESRRRVQQSRPP